MGSRNKRSSRFTDGYLLFIIIAIAWPVMNPCEVYAEGPKPLTLKGARQFGVNIGYGYSFETNNDIRFFDVYPYFGYVLSDSIGKGWYRGNFQGIVEGNLSYVFKDQRSHSTGFNFLARYNFFGESEHWLPYLQVGFGVVVTNLRVDKFHTGLNFTTNAAAGLHYFFTTDKSFSFEWRFQHLSNSGLYDDNAGVNMNMYFLGYSNLF
jgi:hypothetical protein